MNKYLIVNLFVILLFPASPLQAQQAKGTPIDIVFIIDISSSTSGIITSIRNKYWETLNHLSRFQSAPDIRLGLVLIGRPSFGNENDYIKLATNLTYDFESIGNELFLVKELTAKGKVYIGSAITKALKDMNWSKDQKAIKTIFIVGNGSVVNGGGCDKAIELAVSKGVSINTVYFQTYINNNEVTGWKNLSTVGKGDFYVIGIKESDIYFEKNYYNDLFVEAARMINSTYIYYGKEGIVRSEAQNKLDKDAEAVSEITMEARFIFKASEFYQRRNASWDLVDLALEEKIDFSKIKRESLPLEIQKFGDEKLDQYVKEKMAERLEYVSIIKMLSNKSLDYMSRKRDKLETFRIGETFFSALNKTMQKLAGTR